MARLVGLDIGTSSAKALAIDERGHVLSQATVAYPIDEPQPGWFEQNPEDWIRAAGECLDRCGPADAVGITGQMHGAVTLDSSDDPIRPAILWNDQRTESQCREIDERVGPERVRRITGNAPMTGFQAPKLLWMREHEPENFGRIAATLLPKDYVAYQLTGRYATDAPDASGTGVFDISIADWSGEMLEALRLPPGWFPPVVPSFESVGALESGAPVFLAGGDQSANGVGTGCWKPGPFSLALGSSGVAFSASDQARYHPSGTLNSFCHVGGRWLVMGVSLNCGTAFHAAARLLTPDGTVAALEGMAGRGMAGTRLYPHFDGERCPVYDPKRRARFDGIDSTTSPDDLARAVYEGVAFNLFRAYELVAELSGPADQIRLSGGGARSELLRGMLAEVFQLPMVRMESDEGPAFGAALVAGVGIGEWRNLGEACEAAVRPGSQTEAGSTGLRDRYEGWRKGLDA